MLIKADGEVSQEVRDKLKQQKTAYYAMLVDPFNAPLCRPHTLFPTSTSIVRDVESFSLTIGAAGDFCGIFSPTAPFKSTPNSATSAEYMFAARDTTAISLVQTYTTIFTSGVLPSWNIRKSQASEHIALMSAGRVLAAQVKIRYIGRDDAASGIISVGSFCAALPFESYMFTDNAVQELLNPSRCLPKEGCVVTWYPFDETDREFQPVDMGGTSTAGRLTNLAFAFYGAGLPTGTVLDIEVARVIEFVPRPNQIELLAPQKLDIVATSEHRPSLMGEVLGFVKKSAATIQEHRSFYTDFIG